MVFIADRAPGIRRSGVHSAGVRECPAHANAHGICLRRRRRFARSFAAQRGLHACVCDAPLNVNVHRFLCTRDARSSVRRVHAEYAECIGMHLCIEAARYVMANQRRRRAREWAEYRRTCVHHNMRLYIMLAHAIWALHDCVKSICQTIDRKERLL